MSFCTHCGNALGADAKFCGKCGAAVAAPVAAAPVVEAPVVAAPVVEAPVVEIIPEVAAVPAAPVYVAPVVNTEPVLSTKDKVLGFVGMGLGIGALFFAIVGLLYTMIGMEAYAMGFGMSFAFSLFSVPMAIIGRILCGKSMDAGNTSAACSVGSKLSLAAIIVSGVMVFLGFVNLVDL